MPGPASVDAQGGEPTFHRTPLRLLLVLTVAAGLALWLAGSASALRTGRVHPAIAVSSCDPALTGTSGDDVITGTAGPDHICGLGGNDTLSGGGGSDTVSGGGGNDKLFGGTGADTLLGGNGNDRMTGGRGLDNAEGGAGNDRVRGGRNEDTISGGTGTDTLYGGFGADRLHGTDGTSGNDVLNGDGASDTCDADVGDTVGTCELSGTANAIPDAVDDSFPTDQNTALNDSVTANDTDEDADTLTASPGTGPSHGTLTMSPNGNFTYTPTSGYSGPDSFTYTASDGKDESAAATVDINVQITNQPPTDISLSDNTVDENQPSGTSVGTLSATDPDAGDTHTFTLVTGTGNTDNGSFQISVNDLQTAASFNFEAKSSYSIRVRATDSGSLFFEKQFTITVNNVNDAPVAVGDSYSGAIGNTLAVLGTSGSGPNVVLTGNVLTNNDTDEDVPAQTLTAVAETVTSTGGGTATINADGSFTFLPGVGDKNQNDTFTYHVTDGTDTSAGTVTVHIDDFLVWYVNSASGASTHDGRSPSPFLNLSSLNGAGGSGDSDGIGDYIFLYQGSGSYGGGIPLETNQKLFGEKHGLTVNGHSLVVAGATAPAVTNAAGTGVGLANGVDVQGLNISGTSGDGINGVSVTTATVGTTTAVNISSAGGDGVDLSGAATGNIGIASPITGSAGHSVSVANRTGGTTSFSGAISDTGTGISLSSNTGATINLTGGITASTGTAGAFSATGGGTVNVTGASNTLATTTGRALNVDTTTIGASGLTFRSIASNGAVNGILLNTTGSSGGLTVTGTGSAGTGGTIQNSTDSGILGASTRAPNLSFMNFTNNGNALNEGGVRLTNISGTGQLTSTTVTGSFEDNVFLSNSTPTLTGFNIQGPNCTISNNNSSSGNTGVTALATTTSTMTVTVNNCAFTGNRSDTIHTDAGDSATLTSTITNNTITGGSPNQGNIGIEVTAAGSATVTYDVSGNKVGTPDGTTADPLLNTGINIFDGTALTSTMVGKVMNNVVMNDTSVGSGVSNGFGIRVFNSNLANIRAKVSGNTASGVNTDYGILVESSGTVAAPSAGHARVDAEVSNNNVSVESGALDAIRLQARNFNTVCGVITGNTTDAGGTGFTGIQIRQANSAVFQLSGWTDHVTFPSAQSYVANQNPAATVGPEFGTITGVASGTCNIPT